MEKHLLAFLFLLQLMHLCVESLHCASCAGSTKAEAPLTGECFSTSTVEECNSCQAYLVINKTEKRVDLWRSCLKKSGNDYNGYNGVDKMRMIFVSYINKDYGNCGTAKQMFSAQNFNKADLTHYKKLIKGWDQPACGPNNNGENVAGKEKDEDGQKDQKDQKDQEKSKIKSQEGQDHEDQQNNKKKSQVSSGRNRVDAQGSQGKTNDQDAKNKQKTNKKQKSGGQPTNKSKHNKNEKHSGKRKGANKSNKKKHGSIY